MSAICEGSTLTLRFRSASLSELLRMRHAAAEHGPGVRSLRISMGSFTTERSGGFALFDGLQFVDYLPINWDALLQHLPGLIRLDLSEMTLSSPHVRTILGVASERCAALEALVLPRSFARPAELEDQDEPLMVLALVEAMKKWRPREQRPGLRTLRVPVLADAALSTQLIENIAACCPNLEVLEGYHQPMGSLTKSVSSHQRDAALAAWRCFDISCTQLKELHWVVLTFVDPFFAALTRCVKLKLTTLSLRVCTKWNRDEYCVEWEDAKMETSKRTTEIDFRVDALDAGATFKGCPSLRALDITLYHRMTDSAKDLSWSTTRFLVGLANAESFRDAFCSTVVALCPLLEIFAVREAEEGLDMPPIETLPAVTDLDFLTPNMLTQLFRLHFRSPSLTGDSIFEFLNRLPREIAGRRTFDMSVIGGASRMSFYHTFLGLMERIESANWPDLGLACHKFVLRVANAETPLDRRVDAAWSEQYLKCARALVDRVKLKHPSLRVRVTLHGLCDRRFTNAIDFGLYTSSSRPKWSDWDVDESDRSVSFANRGVTSSFHQLQLKREGNDDGCVNAGSIQPRLGGNALAA